MATDFPMHVLVRPGQLDWTPPGHVDYETLWKVFVGSSLLVTKRLFMRWRAYREYSLPIQGTPTESLSEMDSPGSRLDGALAAAATAAEAEAAAAVTEVQEGRLFLKEVKIREKKFEDKIAQLEALYKQEIERMKLGMDSRDQQKNQEMTVLREEVRRQQATAKGTPTGGM